MTTSTHMVQLRDVGMQFEEKKVLDGLSIKVEPEERLVIMGQSGSGKSTILRLILGTLRPNSGSIFFKQFEMTRLPRRKLQQVRRHIGMVYQYSALLSSRNVRDNVALPLEELTDKSRSEIDKIAQEKIDTLITGEAPHWAAVAAEELGMNLLLGGHYATETFGVKALAAHLSKRYNIPCAFISSPTGM